MRKRLLRIGLVFACLMVLPGASWAVDETGQSYKTYGADQARLLVKAPERWVTADHARHEALKQPFTAPEEVTRACLSCHNEAALQVHQTIHWTWLCPADPSKRMGKGGITLNNF